MYRLRERGRGTAAMTARQGEEGRQVAACKTRDGSLSRSHVRSHAKITLCNQEHSQIFQRCRSPSSTRPFQPPCT